jgi:hypothetical protein
MHGTQTMNFYITSNSRVVRSGDCPQELIQLQAGEVEVAHEGSPPFIGLVPDYAWVNVDTNQLVDVRTMYDFKREKWNEIKRARVDAETGGFECNGHMYDSDAVSQQRISGAVQLALMGSGFSIDWTTADNSVVTLDQVGMLSVGVALGAHVQTVFAKGQALRAAIESATTQAEVEAVTW